jgi:hypothetical protein
LLAQNSSERIGWVMAAADTYGTKFAARSTLAPDADDRREITMLTNGSRYWLNIAAIFVIELFVTATVQAAPPIPILACPYNIITPGLYVVTSDLTSAGSCIGIATDDVAIDLQGHKITGDGANGIGISCGFYTGPSTCNHIIIANGTIERFDAGIYISGGFITIASMTVQFNTGMNNNPSGNGIFFLAANVSDSLGGVSSVIVVTNSSAIGNTRDGIACWGGLPCNTAIVTGSEAKNNGGIGILGFGIITDSTAIGNGGAVSNPPYGAGINTSGFVARTVVQNNKIGIYMTGDSSVIDSKAIGNTTDGIVLNGGATIGSITNSIAQNNGGRGILLECPTSAFGNKAINNNGGNLVTSDNTCLLIDNNAP